MFQFGACHAHKACHRSGRNKRKFYMDLKNYYDRGRYRGFLYLDSLVKQRELRRRLVAAACAIEDLDELDYCRLHYERPIAETLAILGFDESFWRRHRLGKTCEQPRRAFLTGFINGIASFRVDKKYRNSAIKPLV